MAARGPTSLGSIFALDVHHDILLRVYDYLPPADALAVAQASKFLYYTYSTSPRLQLANRLCRYSCPPSAPFLHPSHATSSAEKIALLEDREHRLNCFRPRSLETLEKDDGQLVDFEGGLMLFECKRSNTSKRKKMLDPNYVSGESDDSDFKGGSEGEEEGDTGELRIEGPPEEESIGDDESDWDDYTSESSYESHHHHCTDEACPRRLFAGVPGKALQEALAFSTDAPHHTEMTDGWELYRVKGAASDEDAESRGAVKDQGLWRWKTDLGIDYHYIAMCAEDNVVAVVHKGAYFPHGPNPETCALSMRVFFYTLVPPIGTAPPENGDSIPAITHPEAKLPFIEVLIPMPMGGVGTGFALGAGGQMSLLLSNQEQDKTVFAGFWDWKKGVSLGALPGALDPTSVITSVGFLGPFVIASTSSKIPAFLRADLYASALEKLGIPGPHPASEGYFMQLSFTTYTLLPASLGFPPHTPDPPDQNPYAAPYPDVPCSWHMAAIPHVFPAGIFDLPFHDLVPFTLDKVYQPGNFSIAECGYSEDVHNGLLNGVLSWRLSGRTSVINLNTILDVSTAFTLTRMTGKLPRKRIFRNNFPAVPDIRTAQSLPIADQVRLTARFMAHFEYGDWIGADGKWVKRDVVRKAVAPAVNRKLMGSRRGRGKAVAVRKPLFQPGDSPLGAAWLEYRSTHGYDTDNFGDMFAYPDSVPRYSFQSHPNTSHLRMECAPAFSSVYGAREARLVTTLLGDELDENGKVALGESYERISFVLSLNDYNGRTVVFPVPHIEAKREKFEREARERLQKLSAKARAKDQQTIISHTTTTGASDGEISVRLHRDPRSKELAVYAKESYMYERTSYPNEQAPAVLEIDMDLRMMPRVKFDGNTVLLSGFTSGAIHVLTF
ncbi:hypothetical protein I350_00935 [Cryptococcus amylolentus CBS 6273]|uniref:F-box domain-containing protein n=1 Tax=Cryptococcus amylolentus CBS 6273 TaxID=1296118 RepID=A0A1E3KB29_9TREE|nr:hypothetical protein I350_00935 [Cryptococcus amylolentus CBS 6273]